MTEKEFHKMKSQDLVQLLLAQGIDSVRLQETLEASTNATPPRNSSRKTLTRATPASVP